MLINNENKQVQNTEICCLLNAESYDIANYSDGISILVDDAGFYKSGLPVWSIKTPDGITLELIGKLLFVRNIETEYNVDFVSIKAEDIFSFRIGLEIKFIKKTNWDEGPQFVFL
ncbi:hypothetical protein [Bacillus cereus]|uniref:hypothetical protein n=1 Tax=Bacillus cereus TaxID=1396 RepID=UPI0039814944